MTNKYILKPMIFYIRSTKNSIYNKKIDKID